MSSSYPRWQFLAIATAGLVLALGCAQAQPPGPSAGGQKGEVVTSPDKVGPTAAVRGGILNRVGEDPIGWDPVATTAAKTNGNVNLVLEGLTQLITWEGDKPAETNDLRVVPLLAESWEQKGDTEYVFHLRKGVKFKDNNHTLKIVPEGVVKDREMTADDVVWSWKYVSDPLTGSRETKWKAQVIKELTAVDRYTVRVVLKEPNVPFLVYISGNPFWIFPKESWERFGNYKRVEAAIGTGPFIVDEYKPNVVSAYKRNPDYYQKGLPYLDGMRGAIKFGGFGETAGSAFRAGKLDYWTAGFANMESIKKTNPDVQWVTSSAGVGSWIAMRTDQKPFDDIRVRRAVSLAIDYEGIAQRNWGRFAQFGAEWSWNTQMIAASIYYYPREEWPEDIKQWYTYNPKRAKELLAEAGYPNGFDTILAVGGPDYYGAATAEQWDVMVKWLADVGIRANLKTKLYTAFITSTFQGDYEGMAGPQAHHGYSEPNDYSYYLFFPGLAGNRSHVDDPVMNKLLIAQQREFNVEKRVQLLKDVQKRNLEMAFQLGLPQGNSVRADQPWFNGYVPKGGGCWGNFGTNFVRAWIDPSKKPAAALSVTPDGRKVAVGNPQALVKHNAVGKQVSCAGDVGWTDGLGG